MKVIIYSFLLIATLCLFLPRGGAAAQEDGAEALSVGALRGGGGGVPSVDVDALADLVDLIKSKKLVFRPEDSNAKTSSWAMEENGSRLALDLSSRRPSTTTAGGAAPLRLEQSKSPTRQSSKSVFATFQEQQNLKRNLLFSSSDEDKKSSSNNDGRRRRFKVKSTKTSSNKASSRSDGGKGSKKSKAEPSMSPSEVPSAKPSMNPSEGPSAKPSMNPSEVPSSEPSKNPTASPIDDDRKTCKPCSDGKDGKGCGNDNGGFCGRCFKTKFLTGEDSCVPTTTYYSTTYCDETNICKTSTVTPQCSAASQLLPFYQRTGICSNSRRHLDGTTHDHGDLPKWLFPQQTRSSSFLFEPDDNDDNDDELQGLVHIPMKRDLDFVGFTRIPKTGSTTLMLFLRSNKGFYAWNRHLPQDDDNLEDAGSSTLEKHRRASASCSRGADACIFGKAESKTHLGSPRADKKMWNQCPHIEYSKMVQLWSASLQFWTPPQNVSFYPREDGQIAIGDMDVEDEVLEEDSSKPDDLDFTMSLQAFTMVRDPFDRLVSYFYYLRKFTDTNEFLSHTVTEAQYELVKKGDLSGWMESLHVNGGGRGLKLPFQYKFVHDDLETALSLIEGDTPEVYVLVTECYEASLRLLTRTFSGFDSSDSVVDNFIKSDAYGANNNKASYNERPAKDDLKDLREKAKVWFADDFVFYHRAVAQFNKQLARSGMGASQLETCVYWKQAEEDHNDDAVTGFERGL